MKRYDFKKSKCSSGSLCSSQTLYQQRTYNCPNMNIGFNGRIPSGSSPVCTGSTVVSNCVCTISDWFSVGSCSTSSTVTFGGVKSVKEDVFSSSDQRCIGSYNCGAQQTIGLCQTYVLNKYFLWNDSTWECPCQ
ncbi:Hypothetical_protein [Hexamita inflata]|uniref:Hypothetical_protein n=1 Tax=Hexamita inflata TaxID=28002 RepID=A0ABP1GJ01_9EUKA